MELHPPFPFPLFFFNVTPDLAVPYYCDVVSAATVMCILKMPDSYFSAYSGRSCLNQFSGLLLQRSSVVLHC